MAEEPIPEAAEEESVAFAGPEVTEEPPAPEARAFAPPAAEEDEYVDELDVVLPVDEGGEVAPALFDSEEEGGFGGTEEESEAPSEELEEKLQFFFGGDEESFEPEAVEEAVAQKKAEEDELIAVALKEKEKEEEELSLTPALAGEPEDGGFAAEDEEVEAPPEGLEEKLEFFFGEDEGAVKEASLAPMEEEPATALEDVPEALFEDEDEEVLLTPALAAEKPVEEVSATRSPEAIEMVSTPEEYGAALEKIRLEFQEREQSLLEEIASLKEEIESLRS